MCPKLFLFLIGGKELRSELWGKIVGEARDRNMVSPYLTLLCQTHRRQSRVYLPEDFVSKAPRGEFD